MNGAAGTRTSAAGDARTGATAAAAGRDTGTTVPMQQEEALNLLKVAGLPVLKRSLPVLAGLAALAFVALRRRRRHRAS